jgi:vacuolar-type H+-ATPase subunit H
MTRGEEACVSLQEHVESLINNLDRRVTEAKQNSDEALKIATAAQDKRLDLLNEFQRKSQDDKRSYAARETVDSLNSQVSRIWGGLVVVALVGIANLVKLFFTH